MTPEQLAAALRAGLQDLAHNDPFVVPEKVLVERPRQRAHGDWASNVALQVAKSAGLTPRDVALKLADQMRAVPGIARVEVAGPGFLNFTLESSAAAEVTRTIIEQGADFGRNSARAGEVINLEFVSANPTGPLHIGHTRWAALGDSLRRLLQAAGAEVTAEHYINDAGTQMDKFGASIVARARGVEVPEGGYQGAYIAELAAHVVAEHPDLGELPDESAIALARESGYQRQLAEIRQVLADFGVFFDVWFSERELYAEGLVDRASARLREQGQIFSAEGAVWLRTTNYGDDRDRVLIRSDGEPTYFAADAAYYLNKRDRGFSQKIYMLGADHHGYVNRLKAISSCAGDDPEENITVLIGQLVNVDGARLSKRAGNIVELRDLIEWIGADAVRYSLARYPADSPLNLDGEQLRKKTNDNPVFYVQYAYVRTRNVARLAATEGVDRAAAFAPELLSDETESVLLATLGEFPTVVAMAAELLEPHRVARYLERLAGNYHRWYDSCRVRPQSMDDPVTDLHHTRLWLNDAACVVLANGLNLLGVSTPERM
ncbi:MAG: arginine--tRNA ligase [Angustibacter sp.]